MKFCVVLTPLVVASLLNQAAAQSVTRLGAATALDERDIAQIVALASVAERRPFLVSLSFSLVVPPTWHVSAYLEPDIDTPELRRGALVELQASQGSAPRAWQVMARNAAWAEVPNPRCQARSDTAVTEACPPFVVRGLFTNDELLQIVRLVRASPRVPSNQDPTLQGYGNEPISGVWRSGPNAVDVWLGKSLPVIASVEHDDRVWRVTGLRLAGIP